MNKKANTAIFIILATLLNLLLMVLITGLLMALAVLIFQGGDLMPIFFAIAFIGGIALSFVIYSSIMKWISKKYDLEKYLHPIFNKKRR